MEVILSGFIGAVIGAAIAGYATFFAMERNRKKQSEIEFLTRNYLRLVKSLREEKNQTVYELQADAIDEIQLFGDECLAKSAREVCIAAGKSGEIWGRELNKLLVVLRANLRAELGKENIDDTPMHIAYTGPKDGD